MNSIGIMQGRLTSKNGRAIQFFPFDNWKNEFKDAATTGIDEIEFIFDYDRFEENPLWHSEGVEQINSLMEKHKVSVQTICADYFMARPFFRTTEEIKKDNIEVFKKLIGQAAAIGAKRIEIPLLDNSSIKTPEEEAAFLEVLKIILPEAKKKNILINLECDLPPKKLRSLMEKIDDPTVGITYDSGNSSSLGYDHAEEMREYGHYISNLHIKDRVFGGTTVELGTGNANFENVFDGLAKAGYKGSIILQAARGEEGKEKETILKQKHFVKGYISKYIK